MRIVHDSLKILDDSQSSTYNKYKGDQSIDGYTVNITDIMPTTLAKTSKSVIQMKNNAATIKVTGKFSKIWIKFYAAGTKTFDATKLTVSVGGTSIPSSKVDLKEVTSDVTDNKLWESTITLDMSKSQEVIFKLGDCTAAYATEINYYGEGNGQTTPGGEVVPEPEHVCQHVCDNCGKCTSSCQDPACSQKCECSIVTPQPETSKEIAILKFNATDGKSDGSQTDYAGEWTATRGSRSWTITHFNNNGYNNSWSYIRNGDNAKITTNFAFTETITKIIISVPSVSAGTATLEIADNTSFTNATKQTVSVTASTKEILFEIASPKVNCYYRISFSQAKKNLDVSSVAYWGY